MFRDLLQRLLGAAVLRTRPSNGLGECTGYSWRLIHRELGGCCISSRAGSTRVGASHIGAAGDGRCAWIRGVVYKCPC